MLISLLLCLTIETAEKHSNSRYHPCLIAFCHGSLMTSVPQLKGHRSQEHAVCVYAMDKLSSTKLQFASLSRGIDAYVYSVCNSVKFSHN